MLVEDNRNEVRLTFRAMKKANLANVIHVARDGIEALEFISCEGPHADRTLTEPPKVVLLDLKLPKVDGLEVLQRIKSHPRTCAARRCWTVIALEGGQSVRRKVDRLFSGKWTVSAKEADPLRGRNAE